MGNTKGNAYEKELLHLVFEKINTENNGTSINYAAELLEDQLFDTFKYKKSARTLVRYYNKYVLGKEESCGELSHEMNNYLAQIINYSDFNAFIIHLNETKPDKVTKQTRQFRPKVTTNHVILTGGVILLFVVFYFFSFNKVTSYNKQWMVWNEDHYELFTNDMKTDNITAIKLIPYNKIALKYYKKVTLKCDSSIKQIWYYKTRNKELEFFNFHGLHPENGKTLKALTYNMKKKYVCDK